MKKLILLFIVAALFSCKQEQNTEMQQMQSQIDSLRSEASLKDDAINNFLKSFNEIEQNLGVIKEKEKIITISSDTNAELKQEAKDRINDDIQLIYKLMQENKQKLNTLNKKLKQANIKISELEKMLDNLTQQIQNKDAEIADLKTKLEGMNIQIEELTASLDTVKEENIALNKTIDDKTNELNTAYYVFGTDKELRDQKVITKEGGFIGIGKMDKLMENFNKDYFAKIDIRKTKKIDLFVKKVKIITTHPSNSYKLYGNNKADSLVITNPQEFWKVSKYLVIVVD